MAELLSLREAVDYAYKRYLEIEQSKESFSNLKRYAFLRRLMAENVALFRELILAYPRLVGEVYTPQVGNAIKYFHIIKRFFPEELGPFVISCDEILANASVENLRGKTREQVKTWIKRKISDWAVRRYRYLAERNGQKAVPKPSELLPELKIVITDNERILGIGDQGSGGAEICYGKLNCYFLGIGFNPCHFFPIGMDVGTDNMGKRNDPSYDGLKKERLKGYDYYELMDILLDSIAELHPVLVQFEDYKGARAWTTLERFCDEHQNIASFNDDSQGTGAVIVAGLLAAEKCNVKLHESTYLFHGAGGAAIGIAQQIEWLLAERGLTAEEFLSRFIMTDSAGVLYSGREVKKKTGRQEWEPFQDRYVLRGKAEEKLIEFARKKKPEWKIGDRIELLDAIECFSPNIFIGTSTLPGQFTPEVIKAAYKSNKSVREGRTNLVVLALSNPTDRCEILTEEESRQYLSTQDINERTGILKRALLNAIEAANGNIIIATGSPFPDVEWKKKRYCTGQSNNVFVFPGLGYGIDFAKATKVTQKMFHNSSMGVVVSVTEDELNSHKIYPDVGRFTEVSLNVASMAAAAAIQDRTVGIRKELMELRKLNLNEKELFQKVKKLVKESVWYDKQEFHKKKYSREMIDRAADFDFDSVKDQLERAKQLQSSK